VAKIRTVIPRSRQSTQRSQLPEQPQPVEQPSLSPQSDVLLESPSIWTDTIQTMVDSFRGKLKQWRIQYCAVCSRMYLFNRLNKPEICSHCAQQARNGKVSKFGGENDMDPGIVIPLIKLILDPCCVARPYSVGRDVDREN
jgi:hypothetical protein